MKYKFKIVPKSDPNAEGEWVEIELQLEPKLRWAEMDRLISEHIPETHFVVKVETIKEQAKMTEEYLGDGLYASFDGFGFKLRTRRDEGDHWVYLEWDVLAEFDRYRIQIENNRSKQRD